MSREGFLDFLVGGLWFLVVVGFGEARLCFLLCCCWLSTLLVLLSTLLLAFSCWIDRSSRMGLGRAEREWFREAGQWLARTRVCRILGAGAGVCQLTQRHGAFFDPTGVFVRSHYTHSQHRWV
jgi:hypothetical protein